MSAGLAIRTRADLKAAGGSEQLEDVVTAALEPYRVNALTGENR
jgi:hypothetical protein